MIMFREVEVSVSVGHAIVFHFAPSLSIETLLISNAAEETLWEFVAAEFQEVPATGGSFQSWPVDQAPPELLAMLARVQDRLEHELKENGPRKPPLSEITYGNLPAGYREKQPPLSLKPGEYNVLVFAEQGQGSSRFIVPAA